MCTNHLMLNGILGSIQSSSQRPQPVVQSPNQATHDAVKNGRAITNQHAENNWNRADGVSFFYIAEISPAPQCCEERVNKAKQACGTVIAEKSKQGHIRQ